MIVPVAAAQDPASRHRTGAPLRQIVTILARAPGEGLVPQAPEPGQVVPGRTSCHAEPDATRPSAARWADGGSFNGGPDVGLAAGDDPAVSPRF